VNRFRKISALFATQSTLLLTLLPLSMMLTFILVEQKVIAVLIALGLAGMQWAVFMAMQRQIAQKLVQSNQLQAEHTQTQIALHNSETKLSAIFNQALDGMVQIENGLITAANPAFAAMLGYKQGEIVGHPLTHYVVAQDRDLITEAIAARTRGETIAAIYEITLIRHDNSEYPIEIMIGAIQYAGHVTILAIVRGMSIRKQAAQNIQKLNSELQQQAAYLTVLNQIGQAVSRLTDLQSVLRNTLAQFQTIMPLDVFFVILHDAEKPLISFPIMYDDGKFWDMETFTVPLDETAFTAKVIHTGEPLLVNRTADELSASQNPETMVGDTEKVSASILMAPLAIGEQIIGAISVQSYTLNAYDEGHCSLLMGAAYHIAIAVENARLYEALQQELAERKQSTQNIRQLNTELEQQAAHLTVLNQIGQAVSTLTDLKSVLINALEQFKSIMPLDVYFVILHDTDEPMKGFPIMYDSGRFWDNDVLILPLDPNSFTGIVVRTGEPLLVNRTAEELGQAFESMIGDKDRPSASIMMAPLKVGERIIGAISVQSYTLNAYNESHRSLLMGAAYHIAIAVENARLYEALQKELGERKHAEEMVRQLNADLEQRVIQRTEQLQAANQELEAFSYSVSHDLRAPLRSLHGFAHILSTDLDGTVSDEVQHYLNRIQYNAQRMGNLIDDLLALSRIGRAELRITTVDMNLLVQQVLTEMRSDNSLNGTTVNVADLPPCRGDSGLLKLAWVNLIENAVKYSQKREQPHIEILTIPEGNECFYAIQDNGTGFDMQYLDKLFGVFQRLHPAEAYEGTGIGLATVKRIIARHGGQIHARAELDKGATFYFSIGDMA
jgi:PAS domain S-box-containing protein